MKVIGKILKEISKITSENIKKLFDIFGIGSAESGIHLIQPVGFSLPNILSALSHERVESVTLLVTEEVPRKLLDLTIDIANNEIRDKKLAPELVTYHMIGSPDSETREQHESVSKIKTPRGRDAVIGVTGGTQRLVGMLLSRFGSDRVLWVENGPKAVLSIGGDNEVAEIIEERHFLQLYQGAIDLVPDHRWSIRGGRFSITKEVSIPESPTETSGRWRRWIGNLRGILHEVASEISEIEESIGRLQFSYNLAISHSESEERTLRRIESVVGRLPKRVSITVNGERFIDGIESISVNSELTESFIREGVYEWPIEGGLDPRRGGGTLHVVAGRNNSVSVANAISNHRPSRVCIWAISHEGERAEVQALCNQAFTLFGWLSDDLPRTMGLTGESYPDVANLRPPSLSWIIPNGVFFVNTSLGRLSQEVRELSSKMPETSDSIIDLSSGSGMVSARLHRELTNELGELHVSHTHPYTGAVSNLGSGEVAEGLGIGIIDRLWLSQRPVKDFSRPSGVGLELLKKISEKSMEEAGRRGRSWCNLPNRSWGDVTFERDGLDVTFRTEEEQIRLHHPQPNAGYWLDHFASESLQHHFNILDCVASVHLMTRDPVERKELELKKSAYHVETDVEIDVIFMEEDGMGVVSCKATPDWNSRKTVSELLSWKISVGGPSCKAIICHSDLKGKEYQAELPTGVDQINWPETVGVAPIQGSWPKRTKVKKAPKPKRTKVKKAPKKRVRVKNPVGKPGDTIVMLKDKSGMSKGVVARITSRNRTQWKLSNGKSVQLNQHMEAWRIQHSSNSMANEAGVSSEMVMNIHETILPYLPCKWIIVASGIRNVVPKEDRVGYFGTNEVRVEDWGPLLEGHIQLYLVEGVWWVKKAHSER